MDRPRSGRSPSILVAAAAMVSLAWPVWAATPIALDTPVSGSIDTPGGSMSYTFDAPVGTRVYIDQTASSNAAKLNWALLDGYGREIAANHTSLADLGPVPLMGGTYTLTVEAETASAKGTFEFVVRTVVDKDSTFAVGNVVNGSIDTPGQRARFHFDAATPTRVFLDLLSADGSNAFGWSLHDAHDNAILPLTPSLTDTGPMGLPAGSYVLEVDGEGDHVGTFSFQLSAVAPPAAPTTVALGQTVDAAIDTVGEEDVYLLDVPAGTRFFVDFLSSSAFQAANWRLGYPDGPVLADYEPSLGDLGPFTALGPPLELRVRGEGAALPTYSFKLVEVVDTTAPLALGSPVDGAVTTPGGTAAFSFSVALPTTIYIHTVAASNAQLFGYRLFDALGRTYLDTTPRLSFHGPFALAPGDYTLEVDGEGDATGTFTVEVVEQVVDHVAAAVGGSYSGALGVPGERDVYTFDAAPGQRIVLTRQAADPHWLLNWMLEDAWGREVLPRTTQLVTSNSIALQGGTYTLTILGEGAATGTYSFEITDDGTATFTPTGTPIALDESVAADLAAGEVRAYTLDLVAATRVYFDLTAGGFGVTWSVYDSAGQPVAAAANASTLGGGNLGPWVLAAGTYTIELVNAAAATRSVAFVARAVPITSESAGLGSSLSGQPTTPRWRHEVSIELPAATNLTLVAAQQTNLYRWQLLDPQGEPVFGWLTASTDPTQGPFALPSGTYTLVLEGVNEATPNWTIDVLEAVDVTAPLSIGAPVDATLPPAAARLRYSFDVQPDTAALYFHIGAGALPSLRWVLYDSHGEAVFGPRRAWQSAADDQGPFTLPPGSYELVFYDTKAATPTFSFEVAAPPRIDDTLALDVPVAATLVEPGEEHHYALHVDAPARVYFDNELWSGGVYLTMEHLASGWRPVGTVNLSTPAGADRGPLTLVAGDYDVTVHAPGKVGVDYAFTLWTVSDEGPTAIELDHLVMGSIPSPAGSVTYTFEPAEAGQELTFDLLSSQSGLRWDLFDPVGHSVFLDRPAENWANHDRGPFPLAAGTYSLVLRASGPNAPSFQFRIATPPKPALASGQCAACQALDAVFVFDTSVSMIEEAELVCTLAGDIEAGLAAQGIPLDAVFWGITDTANIPCVTDTVLDALGNTVPGTPPAGQELLDQCPPGWALFPSESWATASAILAANYPWTPGNARLVVPFGDEGPWCGDPVDDQDLAAVEHAAGIAVSNDVVVSPVLSTGIQDPGIAMGLLLAQETGGTVNVPNFDPSETAGIVVGLAAAACQQTVDVATPTLSELNPADGSLLPAGVPLVLSGRVTPVNALRPIVGVEIDGEPATLDAAGRFFATVVLQPGPQLLTLGLVEACGTHEVQLALTGIDDAAGVSIPLDEVAPLLDARFDRSAFDLASDRFVVSVAAHNNGGDLEGPLMLALGSPLPAQVELVAADGVTDDGWPYRVVVPDGEVLASGADSAPVDLAFDDAPRRRPAFEPRWLAPRNLPPAFTSTPPTVALAGQPWTYAPSAVDPNGDEVLWSLEIAPAGMVLDTTAGPVLEWTPTAADTGTHTVSLRARDGRGGATVQTFSLEVTAPGANHPPAFTSTPVVHVAVGAAYAYHATASDPDGDPLTFALSSAPAWLAIDPVTGWVTADAPELGQHAVVIEVTDPSGASASQSFTLSVGASPEDAGPVITTSPPLTVAPGALYLYYPAASAAAGATLSWSLQGAPTGMNIDASTGKVTWIPTADQVGDHALTLVVSDGSPNVGTQSFTISVTSEAPNQPPFFTSVPSTRAVAGTPWTYAAEALDPEFGALTFSLAQGPAGMVVSPSAGTVTWTPQAADAGAVPVVLEVTDAAGATGSQAFVLDVRGANAPPVFTSVPADAVLAQGVPLSVVVHAEDADGDEVAYALAQGPAEAIVEGSVGFVTWQTAGVTPGVYAFDVLATDGWGGEAHATWTVEVVADTTPPALEAYAVEQPACLGQTVTVCAVASDASGIDGLELRRDGTALPLDVDGCAAVDATALGAIVLEAWAVDTAGNEALASVSVNVANCADTTAPTVTLDAPLPGSTLTAPTSVVATISDDTPAALTWEVRMGRAGSDALEVVATGDGPVDAGTVYVFDPTFLRSDTYTIEIEASDGMQTGGIAFELSAGGQTKMGAVRYAALDATIPLGGIPITVGRTYDALDAQAGVSPGGDLAVGWRFTLGGEVSDGPAEAIADNPLGELTAEPFTAQSRVYATLPDGRRIGFTFAPTPVAGPVPFRYAPAFEADEGVEETLEAVDAPTDLWGFGGKFFDWIIPYNPSVYRVTTPQGIAYVLDETQGLVRIEDAYGNAIDITEDGAVSTTGATVTFSRDALGRIVEVTGPTGVTGDVPADPLTVRYEYDAAGNLTSAVAPGGGTTTYHYDDPAHPHLLTEVVGPDGVREALYVYDAEGRIAALCGPDGDPATLDGCQRFEFDPVGGVETGYDADGNRTDRFFDLQGRLVVERRWVDATSYADTVFEYDDNGFLIRRTDPGGAATSWTRDAMGRKLSETDPGGFTWTYAYDGTCEEPAQICNPLGDCLTRTFDAACRVTSETDPLGHTTTFTYDSMGNLVALEDPTGSTWTFAYDARGLLVQATDPFGASRTYLRDDLGRMVQATDRNGTTIEYTYDADGNVLSETWQTTPPETLTWTYDAAGQVVSASGGGQTWNYTYWPTGGLRSVDNAGTAAAPWLEVRYERDDNGTPVPGYDGRGHVTDVVDMAGGVTHYAWDALGRLVRIEQSGAGVAPKRVDLAYDASGLLAAMQRYEDLAGASPVADTAVTYDCAGCPLRMSGYEHTWPDGSPLAAYAVQRDGALAVVSATDPEGVHTYLHDGALHLLSATHPTGGVQPDEWYDYDASGHRTGSHLAPATVTSAQTDGAGHRVLETDMATYAYDMEGRLVARTDKAAGETTTLTYDPRGRLTSVTVEASDGTVLHSASYGYAPNDQLTRIEEDGVVRWVVHDGANPILLVDETGLVVVRRLYTRHVDRVVAEEVGGATRWLLTDVLGTVRDVVEGGAVVAHYVYDSFGRQLSGPPPSVDDALRFTARRFSALHGLGYFRARWYDAALGQFAQEDPVPPFGYAYAASNPLLLSDSTGKVALIEYALEFCDHYSMITNTLGIGKALADIFAAVNRGLYGEASDPAELVNALLEALIDFMDPTPSIPCGPSVLGAAR